MSTITLPQAIQGPAIWTHNLSKRFGRFTAVDRISFEVGQGEIFGFLGANGAGKTTAMRMLCGLLQPSEGEAKVAGYDVYKEAARIRQHIGYMSQRFSLYEDLSVMENIRLFGAIYGMSAALIAQKSGEMLEDLQLSGAGKSLVKSLPLGIKQKLAFAVAIFHSPRVVFLDEPTGGVDPVARRRFWEMIYQAAGRGISIFVTTHYMDEAEYCHRLSIMVDGRIEAMDSPANLRAQFAVRSMDEVFRILARKAKSNGE